jgi:hypothetical protein
VASVGDRVVEKHFNYVDDASFVVANARFLRTFPGERVQALLAQLHQEKARRCLEASIQKERRQVIQESYRPSDAGIRCLGPADVSPELRTLAARAQHLGNAMAGHPDALVGQCRLLQLGEGVYAFPCLSRDYCARFVREMEHFHAQCDAALLQRVNTMNRHGASLHELGLTPGFSDVLMLSYARPLARVLLGSEFATLDHHR